VDGCIVFIDPISFSVLKKIQLRYQDYEVPKRIRDSIKYLKHVFKNIIETTGKTIFDIFADITNKDTQSVKIRDFVLKLAQLDNTQKVDDLFQVCITLDEDGNGSISLDEFLHYFEHLEVNDQTEYERLKAEEEMFENIWPEWVIKEAKVEHAKTILTRMYDSLKKTPNISAEQAFEIFDSKEKGLISVEYFKKVLSMFFQESRLSDFEIEFVMRLTPKTVDQ
jgi:Ca2+-binding EF-hand superfamily protein